MTSKDELYQQLQRVGQEQLLRFWDELDSSRQQSLVKQIRELDLVSLEQQIALARSRPHEQRPSAAEVMAGAESPPAFRLNDDQARPTAQEARERGAAALRAGQLGMILVAGGQGSRLGFDQPKGMFPIGPVSGRTLFQVLIERLLAIGQQYGTAIPLYVMTSPATHQATVQFLQEHQYFGLPESDFRAFCQGTMPAIDTDGKILLAAKDELALAPDGHGGMLAALGRSGCLDDARSRGIEHFFYGQIDNPLLQICDPTLIGYHLLSRSDATTQVVAKVAPFERVGNVVSIDGRLRIVEYSDLPNEAAQLRNPDGNLRFWAGSIAVHVFARHFLRGMFDKADALPFHLANKKVPFVDRDGQLQQPDSPNATKFEKFIFDLLPQARNAIVVEVDRAEAFAPVKNPNGADADSPEIAQQMMVQQHRRWFEQAGTEVQDGVAVEISPFFALDAAELATKLPSRSAITENTFFR